MDTLSAWLVRKGIHFYKLVTTTVIMSSSEKLNRKYHLR